MASQPHGPSESTSQPHGPVPPDVGRLPAETASATPTDISDRPARGRRTRRSVVGRFRAVVEAAPDALVVADREGHITLVNHQTEALFGYAREALLGQSVEVLVPARFHPVHQRHRTDYLAAPRTRPMGSALQLFGQRRDGSEFPVEVSLSPLEEAGEMLVIATIRDLSEVQRVHAARAAAEAANEELRRLQALTDTALAHLALEDLLQELLERIHTVMGVEAVGILLLDADGQQLTLRAVRGLEDAVAAGATIPVGQGVSGHVAATRTPLVVDDLSSFPVVYPQLRETEQSAASVPLVVEERLLGVVYAATAARRHFTEHDVQLLQRVADRIALAIDRASAYEAEQRARLEAEAARAEAEVARAEAERQADQLDRIFEALADALIVYDAQGRLVRMNAATRVLLGLDAAPPDFSHLSAWDRVALYAPRDGQGHLLTPQEWLVTRALRGDVLAETEAQDICMRALDGRELEVSASVAPLNREGQVVGAVLILGDRTERNRLAREREEARANELALQETTRSMDEFLAIASHELKSPLATMKMTLQALTRRLYGRPPQKMAPEVRTQITAEAQPFLETAERAVSRMVRLVGDLLEVTRIRVGALELRLAPCDLAAIVRAAVAEQLLVQPSRTVRLEMPAPTQLVPVVADADRLGQVVTNYLTNALTYSQADRPVAVRLEVAGASATVSVQDEGPGIPVDEQARVWELYHRVPGVEAQAGSGVGVGLGLHISRTIVERHGGQVGVESEVGTGSTFWFTLPLAGATVDGLKSQRP
jgi:PAS domain S-box-containing protein